MGIFKKKTNAQTDNFKIPTRVNYFYKVCYTFLLIQKKSCCDLIVL